MKISLSVLPQYMLQQNRETLERIGNFYSGAVTFLLDKHNFRSYTTKQTITNLEATIKVVPDTRVRQKLQEDLKCAQSSKDRFKSLEIAAHFSIYELEINDAYIQTMPKKQVKQALATLDKMIHDSKLSK